MTATLIATLGAEPQVIALATQLLLAQNEAINAVDVLHTQPEYEPVATALVALRAMFTAQPAWPPLQTHTILIVDILTPAEFTAFTDALYRVIRNQLVRGARVHLLLAGGRKSMAMLGMSVAQLLLGPEDRVWYLHSTENFRQSRTYLLTDPAQAQLIPIPLPQQSAAPPIFRRFAQAETAEAARLSLQAERNQQIRHFLTHELTNAERQVAQMVAGNVLTVKEIAAQLHKSPKTVTNQLNSVYSKLESYFGLQPDVGVKREFLRRELGGWLDGASIE
ncbi:MAG: CRISPR-associated ring nuclease [Caldilineaceae bacterium]